MEQLSTIQKIAVIAPPFVLSVILHEVAHGWVAEKLGDPTARNAGRLTLNPIRHIDPYWTIILPLLLYFSTNGKFVLGGAKPVPINPDYFKKPRRDMALSSLAGPGANLLIAFFCAVALRIILPLFDRVLPQTLLQQLSLPLTLMFGYGAFISIALAVFNLLPIPPLDGSRIAYWLLPDKLASIYYRFESFGILIVFALFAFGLLGKIIWPVIIYILYYLLGNDILVFMIEYLFK